MTTEIILTLSILLAAVVLLVAEILRADLIALLVLVALALSGLLEPSEALSGFSDSAVITVWAIFILSGALARTGVANRLGASILRIGGNDQNRLIVVIMLLGGSLSAFMNNVGVAALMLPVVTHIARKTKIAASKLLIPLAFGTLLGGMMTLIGTPPNILVSEVMADFNLPAFSFFDFIYLGLPILIGGTLYMRFIGHRLLPDTDKSDELSRTNAEQHYDLSERFFSLKIPKDSLLAGKSLAESRIGSALKLSVIGIRSGGKLILAPHSSASLNDRDELIVLGRSDWLEELSDRQQIDLKANNKQNKSWAEQILQGMITDQVTVIEARLPAQSTLVGKSIRDVNFRQTYHGNVLAILGESRDFRTSLQGIRFRANEKLLIHISREHLATLSADADFEILNSDVAIQDHIGDRILEVAIPAKSGLVGKNLAESKLADTFGLSVLALRRGEILLPMPSTQSILEANDRLIVEGLEEDVLLLRALRGLEISREVPLSLDQLESEDVGLVEVVISPRSSLNGKSLQEINFREKFGLNVLAIWRNGRSTRSNLREFNLRVGDSILIYGHRNRIRLLKTDEDFLVLGDAPDEAPRHEKSRTATLIMGAVVVSAGLGLLPIAIAAVTGATLMVLTRCIDMEEAYSSIHWQSVFLIAGMLPLGIAMQSSGAALYLADQVITLTSPYGSTALLAGLFALTMLASQVMPNAVVAVLMAPIAINTALSLDYSPQALVMVVAVAASATFLSPVGHPSNILVMGPGSYRFTDFIKVGLPLSILVGAIALFLLPIFWPL